MSSIGELVSRLTADKQRADELEADIERTNAEADELIEQMTALGFHTQAAQISEAKAKASQAQNARWAAEGHLEGAISVLQAVLDGQKGIGTKIPGGAADQAGPGQGAGAGAAKPDHGPLLKADDKSFVTEWNGQPVKIIFEPPKPEHEQGPSGEELVERASERRGSFLRGIQTGVRKFDDASGGLKDLANSQYDAARALNPPPTPTNTVTVQQHDSPQMNPVPRTDANFGDALTAGLALGVFGMAVFASKRDARQRKKEEGDGS